jgi:hypothetical protein
VNTSTPASEEVGATLRRVSCLAVVFANEEGRMRVEAHEGQQACCERRMRSAVCVGR